MTHLLTALVAVLVCLSLMNIALTRQAVRPVSACEAQSIADLRAPFKGTIYEVTFDGRTE